MLTMIPSSIDVKSIPTKRVLVEYDTVYHVGNDHMLLLDQYFLPKDAKDFRVESDAAWLLVVDFSLLQFCEVNGSGKYCCSNCHSLQKYCKNLLH